MNGINTGKVFLGGLLAGLIINIGEFGLNSFVLVDELEAAMMELGLSGQMSGNAIGAFVVVSFMIGILAVWLYAAARPRLGAGPGTALKIGLVVWLLAYGFPQLGFILMEMFPPGLVGTAMAWTLVEVVAATVVGAWVYQEGRHERGEAAGAATAPAAASTPDTGSESGPPM